MAMGDMSQMVHNKFERASALESLLKNEVMVAAFDDGDLRFDFGAKVPEKIKKAAIEWAKKRGLRPVEASLAKSVGGPSYIYFSTADRNPAAKMLSYQKKSF
jgi:hypothetical protein